MLNNSDMYPLVNYSLLAEYIDRGKKKYLSESVYTYYSFSISCLIIALIYYPPVGSRKKVVLKDTIKVVY